METWNLMETKLYCSKVWHYTEKQNYEVLPKNSQNSSVNECTPYLDLFQNHHIQSSLLETIYISPSSSQNYGMLPGSFLISMFSNSVIPLEFLQLLLYCITEKLYKTINLINCMCQLTVKVVKLITVVSHKYATKVFVFDFWIYYYMWMAVNA